MLEICLQNVRIIGMNLRQRKILAFIQSRDGVGSGDVAAYLAGVGMSVSDMTIIRDLDSLARGGYIIKTGKTKSARYQAARENRGLLAYPLDDYFAVPQDERGGPRPFSFDVFALFADAFMADELRALHAATETYRTHMAALEPIQIKKETERLTIDLSWKSSRIEGNTYDLIETETLLKEHKEAQGRSKEEARMLLNHKAALDYIFSRKDFKTLTRAKIEDLHRLLVEDLGVPLGLRRHAVRITGTNYHPLDNEHQIREAIEKAIDAINMQEEPIVKAFMTVLLVSYVQPFADGNKRTARILGDAILLSYDHCPLSYRSVDESAYKKAMILFYEQQSFAAFKELFIEQYLFAARTYFVGGA